MKAKVRNQAEREYLRLRATVAAGLYGSVQKIPGHGMDEHYRRVIVLAEKLMQANEEVPMLDESSTRGPKP